MISQRRSSKWFPFAALAMLGLVCVAAVPRSFAQQPQRDQKIAELEKQLADLARKLEELKKSDAAAAAAGTTIPDEWIKSLKWRPIGPASMGGRITSFAVFDGDPCTYWVGTASGGLLKTTNNGVTFEHQFDHEATVSVGDVCVAPSDRNIVWVGTGENNPRNSVSFGDGVYKSTDGGKTWKNMGLRKTFQIGKVLIHPKNPDIVYVGALGRLYGPSEDRGLFKTTDGGNTWQKVFYVDDKTGVIDMRMNPADPETLIVAMWERRRDEFDSHRGDPPIVDGYDAYDPIKKWGPGGGLFKTTDGGKTFRKLTNGLPGCATGRIGIDFNRKNPNLVFAIIDTEKIGMGKVPAYLGVTVEDATDAVKLTAITANSPAAKAELKVGDLVKAVDMTPVKSLKDLDAELDKHASGDKIKLRVGRDNELKDIEVTLGTRPQEGVRMFVFVGVFGEDVEGGVRLTQVMPDSAGEKAGLKVGDIVQAIDKKEIKTFREFQEDTRARKAGDKVTLKVQRDNQAKDIAMTLEERPAGGGGGGPSRTRPYSFNYGGQRENVANQGPDTQHYGGIYKSADGGESWTRINSLNPRPMYFSLIRVDPSDEQYLYVGGISLYRSKDGGKTFTADGGNGVHPDQHALWVDARDGRHMLVGCDGGFYATYDRMDHWDYLNNVAIGQFYHVAVDSRYPYRVYGGMQDNGSWGGPSHILNGPGPINDDWVMVSGGDGFVCRVDPNDPDLVYFESQDGNIGRRNLRTGERGGIRPRVQPGLSPYRFNWNTPFLLSNHNSKIVYAGGNYVFRSLKQGDDMRPISPEISRTGRGTATALAESPRNPDILWAGTDDGNLWVSKDNGVKWVNVAGKVGLPGPRCVASIEASRHADGRAYVTFDGHRSDDDEPYVYVTEDFGETWKSLRGSLPTGSTRVLREDIKNKDLLFLGTEFACWVSADRGASWTKLNNNLPTVAVHEFAIHPTAGEMVAATHGRSLWVLDITPLRQLTSEVLKSKTALLEPNTVIRWRSEPERGTIYGSGSRFFQGENAAAGAQIFYLLGKKADKVSLKVFDFAGKLVRDMPATLQPGLHLAVWDLRRSTASPTTQGPGGQRFPAFGPLAAPGQYRVVLNVDGQEFTQTVRVENDPTRPTIIAAPEESANDKAGEEKTKNAWKDR